MESSGALNAHTVDDAQPSQASIDLYRTLSADIASGVAVASTLWRKRDYAATVTGHMSVSYDPPTMLVSLYDGGRIADAVSESGTWALSLLGSGHQSTANWLASPGAPLEGLLTQVPFRRGPATGAVIIDGALAYFELRTVDIHEAATHLLVVGEVLSMGRDASGREVQDPLIHHSSSYRRLAP
ncbi:flavin reductase family protein [Arthrobacter castelli]|uniref:flavin reductase family protein n=1 Tax=Arthrobacter castelli TaxID=271431 RepID=UPI000420D055|nr:flavin reductase family protein [Arthrobacter castelli]